MAEYYNEYLNYKHRLLTLQIKVQTDSKLNDKSRSLKLSYIDYLLKNLDERYMEEKNLSFIETLLEKIEKDE